MITGIEIVLFIALAIVGLIAYQAHHKGVTLAAQAKIDIATAKADIQSDLALLKTKIAVLETKVGTSITMTATSAAPVTSPAPSA